MTKRSVKDFIPDRKVVVKKAKDFKQSVVSRSWVRLIDMLYAGAFLVIALLYIYARYHWLSLLSHNSMMIILLMAGFLGVMSLYVMYYAIPYVRRRWGAYREASNLIQALENTLSEHDENNHTNLLTTFESLSDKDAKQVAMDEIRKTLESNIYMHTANVIGLDAKELYMLSDSKREKHKESVKAFVSVAHHIYRKKKSEIEKKCTQEEFYELQDVFSIEMDKNVNVLLFMHEPYPLPDYHKEIRDRKLTEMSNRLKFYASVGREGLVDKEPWEFLILVKLALNELYVIEKINANHFGDILRVDYANITQDQINRAILYHEAMYGDLQKPRHMVLAKVFFNKTSMLSEEELRFIFCVLDKIYKGKLPSWKTSDQGYCKESYIDMIDKFKPEGWIFEAILEDCINVIQCVDAIEPVALDRNNLYAHQKLSLDDNLNNQDDHILLN